MWLLSYFASDGVPKTGLSPTLTVIKVDDDSIILNGVSMVEISNGFYKYNFTTYDPKEDYVMISDGGVALSNSDRYVTSSNNLSSDVNDLDRFNKSSMVITGTDLKAYDGDGTLQEWDLEDSSGDPSDIDIYHRIKK